MVCACKSTRSTNSGSSMLMQIFGWRTFCSFFRNFIMCGLFLPFDLVHCQKLDGATDRGGNGNTGKLVWWRELSLRRGGCLDNWISNGSLQRRVGSVKNWICTLRKIDPINPIHWVYCCNWMGSMYFYCFLGSNSVFFICDAYLRWYNFMFLFLFPK